MTLPNKLEEIDRLRLALDLEKGQTLSLKEQRAQGQLVGARQDLTKHQEKSKALSLEFKEKYKLEDADSVEVETGEIHRGESKKPALKVVEVPPSNSTAETGAVEASHVPPPVPSPELPQAKGN